MPKSKKKKKADFQKVKLKVGKKLTKGDNVTNLSFKTRQIQLTQTIRDGTGAEPVTKRKLNIQDLLRQCDHHGVSARVNAVSGLKELWLGGHQELVQPSNNHGYGTILQKLSTMFIDNEAVVRHSVISLFKLIITKVCGPSKVAPQGFPVLHIHTFLCCALTHVHEDIKLDGLLVFDALLDSLPAVMTEQTGDLLAHLLAFISSPGKLGARGDSTTQRLSLNPDSKLPVMQFRGRVLARINRLFQIAVNSKGQGEHSLQSQGHHTWSVGADHQGNATRQDSAVLPHQNIQRFAALFTGASHELDSYLTKPSTLETFVTESITVLTHCWREARASVDTAQVNQHTQAGSSVVSHDSAHVMSMVVSIIQAAFTLCGVKRSQCLSEEVLVPPEVLVASRGVEFEKLFMSNFPYSIQVQGAGGKKRKRKSGEMESSPAAPFSLDDLNLGLCAVMSSLLTCPAFRLIPRHTDRLQAFLRRSLADNLSAEHCTLITRCLQNMAGCPQALEKFLPSFESALKMFHACTVSSTQKRLLYKVFADLSRRWNGQTKDHVKGSLSTCDIVIKFYSSLPSLLLDVTAKKGEQHVDWAVDIVGLMTRARAQGARGFSDSFMAVLPQYLDPDTGVLEGLSESVLQQLFALIALGTPLTKAHYRLILQALRQDGCLGRRKSHSMLSHVLTCVCRNVRCLVPLSSQAEFSQRTEEQETRLSEYLNFMLSLQIGVSKEILDQVSPCSGHDSHPQREVTFDVDPKHWDRHTEIAQCVAHELTSLHLPACPEDGYREAFDLSDSVTKLWLNTFRTRSKIHILPVYSLMTYLCQLSKLRGSINGDFLQFSASVVASTLLQLPQVSDDSPDMRRVVWGVKVAVVTCLEEDAGLLKKAWAALGDNNGDKTAINTAKEFLLSHSKVKQRTEELNLT